MNQQDPIAENTQAVFVFNPETFQADAIKAMEGTGYEDRNPLWRIRFLVNVYKRASAVVNDLEAQNNELKKELADWREIAKDWKIAALQAEQMHKTNEP